MKVFSSRFVAPESPSSDEFELLQTIAALTGELGYSPPLRAVAEVYGVSRQAIHKRVKRLRNKGLVEELPNSAVNRGLTLTRNAVLEMETSLGAALTH